MVFCRRWSAFFNDQNARAFIVRLNRGRQTGSAAADHHHISFRRRIASRPSAASALLDFSIALTRLFYRFALAGCAGNRIHVRVLALRIRSRILQSLVVNSTVCTGFAARAISAIRSFSRLTLITSLVGVVLNGFDEHPRFDLRRPCSYRGIIASTSEKRHSGSG